MFRFDRMFLHLAQQSFMIHVRVTVRDKIDSQRFALRYGLPFKRYAKIVGVVAEISRDSATTHACLRLRLPLETKRSRRFLMDQMFEMPPTFVFLSRR